ncbi:MAG TPA: FimV/HubP family polar landmark protein [Gallionella sp.]|nr:FimV/HubP family polar landmark protein [Gallionella sp.]
MHKSLLKLLGFVVALALSASASALGLGGINVVSALGQPLKADIELVSVGKAEKASLVARLASADAYKGAGLEYPYGNKFKFQVEHRADGNSYLVVSSAQPVNDPFVSLLVELTWSSGKLLREYTFLLDPPDYVPEQPAPAEVVAVAPVAPAVAVEPAAAPADTPVAEQGEMGQQSSQEEADALKKQAETMRAEAPSDEKALAKQPAPARKPVEKAVPAGEVVVKRGDALNLIDVKRGDTLNLIAAENKPVDVSLERMLVALYRANAGQFDGKNMNRIKAGKILRLPAQEELMGVSQIEAAKEIRAQAADWNAYRQKLASAAPMSSQGQDAQQVSSGKISSSVTDKAPVAKDSAREVLKLSKGEAPGDQTAAGGGKTLSAQDKKNAANEEAIAKAKAMEEEKTRLAMLEQNLKDMQRLAELKSQAAALTQSASAVSDVAAAAAASAVEAASDVAAASAPVAQPQPKVVAPKVVEPEPTLVDEILGNPIYLAGGAAVLAALGGLGYMVQRRRKSPVVAFSEKQDEVGEITGRITTPPAPSPDTGDFTMLAATNEVESAQSDDVDPISEADLFLNFGRDTQAEEVLKEALLRTPDDHRIHLKLLGIYANRVDVNSFAAIARQLQISGDEPAWEQAAAMGRKLEPNNPMYGGPSIEDAASATMQTTVLNTAPEIAAEETSLPAVDFDLGEGDAAKTMILSPEEMPAAQEVAMDFDLTSTNPMQAVSPDMDFDITSTNPSMPAATVAEEVTVTSEAPAEAVLPNLDDLVFDITSTSLPAAEPEEMKEETKSASHGDDDVMEFSLDFPVEEVATKPAAEAPAADIGLSGISLNLDDIGAPAATAAEVVKDERWHEVATKLDLARAYQEMGDQTGAREILEEVLRDGDSEQQEAAQALIDQLI